MLASISSRHAPNKPAPGLTSSCVRRTPQIRSRAFAGPFSAFQNPPDFRAQKPFTRCPTRLAEWSFWNPFGSDRRGTQTHSRRTERKLGQLRYARQGLVRLSESNTKYGGQNGKTGVSAAPVIGPSISESTRIRKGKKCRPPRGFWLRPDLHRGSIFLAQKCCVSETHITL